DGQSLAAVEGGQPRDGVDDACLEGGPRLAARIRLETAGAGLLQPSWPGFFDLVARQAAPFADVDLPEPGHHFDADLARGGDDLGRLQRSPEVGGGDHVDSCRYQTRRDLSRLPPAEVAEGRIGPPLPAAGRVPRRF